MTTPTKSEESDRLEQFVGSLPPASYLADIFTANGLAAEIIAAIRNDIGCIDLRHMMDQCRQYRDQIAEKQTELNAVRSQVFDLQRQRDRLSREFDDLASAIQTLANDAHRAKQKTKPAA